MRAFVRRHGSGQEEDRSCEMARLRGHADVAAFTGSHRFVLDYLAEEVLEQQSEQVTHA